MHKVMITFALIKILEIRQCIWVSEILPNSNNLLKQFSSKNIPVAYTTRKKILTLFEDKWQSYWSTLIIFEVDSMESLNDFLIILEDRDQLHLLPQFSWLIFSEDLSLLSLEESYLPIPLDCEMIFALPDQISSFKLIERYRVKDKNFMFKYGEWDPETGLNATELSFMERRTDLDNVSLKVATTMYDRRACGPGRFMGCAEKEVFREVKNILNFHMDVINKTEENRMEKYADADIIDDVYFFHLYFYQPHVCGPLFKSNINFYIKEPNSRPQEDYFIHPYSPDLWLSILFTVIVSSFIVSIIGQAIKRFQNDSSILVDDIFTPLECFCNQDGSADRKFLSSRMACMSVRLVALLMVPAYSAVIISFLAVRIPKIPFRSLEEFVKNGEYTLIRKENAAFPRLYFQNNTDPTIRTISAKFLKAYPEGEGIRKTCKGKFAMVAPNMFQKSDLCKFYQIDRQVTFTFIGIMLKKHSPLKNVMNHALLNFYSSGVRTKLEKVLNGVPIKEEDEDAFYPVDISQMVLVLMFVPGGVAIAMIILIFENLANMSKKNRSSKRFKNDKAALIYKEYLQKAVV